MAMYKPVFRPQLRMATRSFGNKILTLRPNMVLKRSIRPVTTMVPYKKRKTTTLPAVKRMGKILTKRKNNRESKIILKTGFLMYKGSVHGNSMSQQNQLLPEAKFANGLAHALRVQFRTVYDVDTTTTDFTNTAFMNTIESLNMFIWCPYHPGGTLGWFDSIFQTDGASKNVYFANQCTSTNAVNYNFPAAIGPCNDNFTIHTNGQTANDARGYLTDSYKYTICWYRNEIEFVNNGTIPVYIHVLTVKFKSKCLSTAANDTETEFKDNFHMWNTMTIATGNPTKWAAGQETLSAMLKAGKLPKKLFKVLKHKKYYLQGSRLAGVDYNYTNAKSNLTIKFGGKCNIVRGRTCATSMLNSQSFDAKEQLKEKYNVDTYKMMYITPATDHGILTPGDVKTDVVFSVKKTVLYKLPRGALQNSTNPAP